MAKKTSCTPDSVKVTNPIKKKIGADLIEAGMDGNRRFHATGQALAVIADILKTYGIEWDEVLDGFKFSRASGRAAIRLAAKTDDIFCVRPIVNTSLAFQWETLESDSFGRKVEVIAYLG